MNIKYIILVGIGGMAGSMLRYLCSQWIKSSSFSYATLTVNISGAFLMGLIMAWAARHPEQEQYRLLLATGICGGFTTFSAFAWENLQLLQQGRITSFCLYSGSTLILGFLAVWLGYIFLK